jgi:hypothetical protein
MMYQESFVMNEVGYGSAIAVILALVLLVFGIMFINSREKKNAKATAKKITKETGTQSNGFAGDVRKAPNAVELN